MKLPSKKKKPQLEGAVVGDATKHTGSPKVEKPTSGLKVDSATHVASSTIETSRLTEKQKMFGMVVLVVLLIMAISCLVVVSKRDTKIVNDPIDTAQAQNEAGKKVFTDQANKANTKLNDAKTPEQKAAAYNELASASINNGDTNAAVVYVQKSVEVKPTADSYAKLGYMLADQGNNKAAAEAFRKASEFFPKTEDLTINNDYTTYYGKYLVLKDK